LRDSRQSEPKAEFTEPEEPEPRKESNSNAESLEESLDDVDEPEEDDALLEEVPRIEKIQNTLTSFANPANEESARDKGMLLIIPVNEEENQLFRRAAQLEQQVEQIKDGDEYEEELIEK